MENVERRTENGERRMERGVCSAAQREWNVMSEGRTVRWAMEAGYLRLRACRARAWRTTFSGV